MGRSGKDETIVDRALPGPQWDDMARWSCGVDWVTCSHTDDREDGWAKNAWNALYNDATEARSGQGAWERSSILGYAGRLLPGLFVGVLPGQGALCRVTGAIAAQADATRLDASNCSRLDIQASFWVGAGAAAHPAKAAAWAVAGRSGLRGGQYGVNLSECKTGPGATCYIGGRTSELFVRIYDKGAEAKTKEYEGCVRYEAELKGRWAWRAYQRLATASDTALECYTMLSSIMALRGIGLPARTIMGPPFVKLKDDTMDSIDRSLHWLGSQVGGTVEKLLSQGVPLATILEKLRLIDKYDIISPI